MPDIRALRALPPLVVGCTGGSGSRLVAEVLQRCGCYMGRNLNFARDNMDFAFCLGGRVSFLNRYFPFENCPPARRAVGLFESIYFGERLNMSQRLLLLRIGISYLLPENRSLLATRPLSHRLKSVGGLFARRDTKVTGESPQQSRWAIKLPGSMLFLHPLLDVYPAMKFVHLVRDGRDMALSSNQKLLYHYAGPLGLTREYSFENSYELWSRMNTWVNDTARSRMQADNYLLLRFEDLCNSPRNTIDQLLDFAGLAPPDSDSVYDVPQPPASIGRWREEEDACRALADKPLRLFGYMGPTA